MATNDTVQIENEDNDDSTQHYLQCDDYAIFTAVNEWERHSIAKIQLAAQQVRNDLRQLFNKKHQDFVYLLSQINKQISTNSSADINLNKWTDELNKLRHDVSNVSSYVHLEHDKTKSPIYLIKLFPQTNDRVDKDTDEENINVPGTELLTATILRQMTPIEQKQMLGERLFVLVQQIEPKLAAKITGMFVELDTKYILILIKSHKILKEKIKEALNILKVHQYRKYNVIEA